MNCYGRLSKDFLPHKYFLGLQPSQEDHVLQNHKHLPHL